MKKLSLLFIIVLFLIACNTREDNPVSSNDTSTDDTISDDTTTVVDSDISIDVKVKTVSYNGHYAPKNIGAIWIEDSDGNFVKTLKVWANKEISHLVAWKSATGSNKVDAVTGATKNSHATREVTWNATDVDGNIVENGNYKMRVECSEGNSRGSGQDGKLLSVNFELSDSSEVIFFDDQTYFKDIEITINR